MEDAKSTRNRSIMSIMMRIHPFFATFALLACMPVEEVEAIEPPEEPPVDEVELCDAPEYRPLIGGNIAAVSLPSDPMIRAFGKNDLITQDYRPERVNIVYDEAGVIFRVYCG